MRRPWLHEPQEWRGHWWLPEAPDQRMAGWLRYEPGDGLTLTLIGGFEDGRWIEVAPGVHSLSGGQRDFPVIHGLAGATPITLFDGETSHMVSNIFGFTGPTDQTVTCATALIGLLVQGEDDPSFAKVHCLIEDSWLWSSRHAMQAQTRLNEERTNFTGEASMEMKPVDEVRAEADGWTFQLAHWLILPTFDHTRGAAIGRMEDSAVFTMSRDEAFSYAEVQTLLRALQDLLALATGRGPSILWFILRVTGNESDQPAKQVEVFTRSRGTGDPKAKALDSRELVFSLEDIPFDQVIPQWWDVRERFRASCNMILGSRYGSQGYLETMLTTAVTAAESFHKDLAEPVPVPKDEMDQLVKMAVDAMPEDRKQWIKNVIPRGHSLRQRLDRLADRLSDECRTRLLPDASAWAKAAKGARNDLSHSGKTDEDMRRLYAIMRITRAVVLLNILIEMGLSEDRLLKALSENGELSHACDLARTYFPAAGTQASSPEVVK